MLQLAPGSPNDDDDGDGDCDDVYGGGRRRRGNGGVGGDVDVVTQHSYVNVVAYLFSARLIRRRGPDVCTLERFRLRDLLSSEQITPKTKPEESKGQRITSRAVRK